MQKTYVHRHSKWHATTIEETLSRLETDPDYGLSEKEAAARLMQFGLNVLPAKKKKSSLIRFLSHFNDILIYILLLSAFITLVLRHYADTVVIIAVAVINAAIGFFQESKAEKALEDIKTMLSLKAIVVRNGKRDEAESSDLTIGDIVVLAPGDKVPADLRLIQANNLRIEESALTGEAEPSDKQTTILDAETMLGDRSNMAFSGTTVSSGTGTGVVVAIGLETELGHISQLLTEVEPMDTPLLKQMSSFSKTISAVIIGIAAAIYLFGHFFRAYSPTELLLSSIGLAIAAIPEGLPAILSIILAIGVQNMAKRKAIVRNLPSVETLGSVSVICSDKTGTLTKNEMTVKSVLAHDGAFEVSGTGYSPEGRILKEGKDIDINHYPSMVDLLNCFRLCNDSSLDREDGQWEVRGNPTEGALIALYEKAGLSGPMAKRIATIPFDSEYKYMATLVRGDDGNKILIKGAPDRLLDLAAQEESDNGAVNIDVERWETAISGMASQGQRIIGAAVKYVDNHVNEINHDDIQDGVIFLGLAGIVDPPRDEVSDSIAACHQAGITVKMITGDHADTAKSIGKEMGIGDGENVLMGRELDEMTEEQLEVAVHKCDIFARTSPENKLKLVKAIQADGSICAMTGDGVNDAPALKMANVGVAMGIKGTEVTKDSAEIVLADDNFSTIVSAVEEGRRVYDNLKKTILFILPTNGAESFLIIASILFGTLIPLTPVQILWVNMVTSITISLALAFEKAEPGAMQRKPRSPKTPLLNGYFIWRIIFVSILIGGITLLMNVVLHQYGYDQDVVNTITLQTIVMCQLCHLFNSRSIRESAFAMDFFSNRAVLVVGALLIILQLAVTYLPFMNAIFGTVSIGFGFWLIPIGLGILVFLLVEAEKYLMRRFVDPDGETI